MTRRRTYQLRLLRDGREVHGHRLVIDLALDDTDVCADLLERHLEGAVRRLGALRRDRHEYVLEVRNAHTDDGRAFGEPVRRIAFPVDPDERW